MTGEVRARAEAPPLNRERLAQRGVVLPKAPERIVHVGLGAFHRAHQAWYTAHARDAHEWGIVAYTGRRADVADLLAPQDGVYTLAERGPESDSFEHVGSIVRVVDGNDLGDFFRTLSSSDIAIVTITITEAGYRLTPDGLPDDGDPELRDDVQMLRRWLHAGEKDAPAPRTTLGRLLAALELRRRGAAPPIAVVPCDNMPDNGAHVERALRSLAERISPELAHWLPQGVRYVSTSVDRITPRVEAADLSLVEERTGWADASPVVTEPFRDWVLSGQFPSGRPAWEAAGARFVDEITPWENRKLWMLNGAHTVLACAGLARGYSSVSEAMADGELVGLLHGLWDEAARNVPEVETEDYRRALVERFGNRRIVHRLEQIAQDSLLKLRVRIVPVAAAEVRAGRSGAGAAAAIASYLHAVRVGAIAADGDAGGIASAATVAEAIALIDPALAEDVDFCAVVHEEIQRLGRPVPTA